MLDKIKYWYHENQFAITWFIIGMCTITGIGSIAAGNYVSGIINLSIAYLNYILNKR